MHVIQDSSITNTGRFLLWSGMLVGPGLWIVQLFVLYALEDVISCTPASATPGLLLGVQVHTVAALITTVVAALTLLAGAGSFYCWRTIRNGGGQQTGYQWMAVAGMLTSTLFLPVILIKLVPLTIIGSCVGGL